jgi:hypothetical protein
MVGWDNMGWLYVVAACLGLMSKIGIILASLQLLMLFEMIKNTMAWVASLRLILYSSPEPHDTLLSDGRVFSEGNAELLVYLVDGGKDIYIGVCRFAI